MRRTNPRTFRLCHACLAALPTRGLHSSVCAPVRACHTRCLSGHALCACSLRRARSTRVRASTSSESSVCTSPAQWIEDNLQTGPITDESFQGGSQWSSAYVLKSKGGQAFFVKTARGRDESMFRGEALGLQAMRGKATAHGLIIHASAGLRKSVALKHAVMLLCLCMQTRRP